jgi:formate C-acetyltransferase
MNRFREPSERFAALRSRLLAARPELCPERARFYTQSYKETEGEAMIIRRAKALSRVLENMTLFVADDDLFVGNQARSLRACPVYPESEALYMEEEIDIFPVRDNDRVRVDPEVRRELLEELLPYWKDKNSEFISLRRIPEETRRVIDVEHQVFSPQLHQRGSLAHTIADYSLVLKQGYSGLKAQAAAKMAALDLTDAENLSKRDFYEAAIICMDASIAFARRYAVLLREKAAQEPKAERQAELIRMASNCERVPEFPAEDFYQALQSFWFVHLILYIEQNGLAISVGRFDQFMYPYYKKDIESGLISQEEAQEYLDILWIKFTEIMRAYDLKSSIYYGGFAISENLILGGVDTAGHDATNALSYMCLDSERKTKLSQPNTSIRVHPGAPDDFLRMTIEVIKTGGGKPQIFNDIVAIPLLMDCGASLSDARDYCVSGCVEAVPPGTVGVTNACMSNLGKAFELALNDGECLLCGERIGPPSGRLADFRSMDDVIAAFRKQVEFYVRHMVISINAIEKIHGEMLQLPYSSITMPDCLEKGRDITHGGARYMFTGPQGVGLADVVDSLAAMDLLLFQTEQLKPSELMAALKENFENSDLLWRRLRKAPKYGNDNDEVDRFAPVVSEIYCSAVSRYKNAWGGKYRPGLYPVSSNVPLGEAVSALPSGRKAGQALADGISPEHYMDLEGPTAVMRSASKLDHTQATNGTLLNQKFNPVYLDSEENIGKLADLVRGYFDLGGWHIQFNVVSADTLRAAQQAPEKYPGLLVRVAGYSAFFAELSKVIQDDIIERTEFAAF